MWGMGNSNGGNFNLNNMNTNDPEHQRLAAAALQAQLEHHHAIGYSGSVSGVPDMYTPSYYTQNMTSSNLHEEQRRMAIALALEHERNLQNAHNLYQDRDLSELQLQQLRNNFYSQDVSYSNQPNYYQSISSNSIDRSSPYNQDLTYSIYDNTQPEEQPISSDTRKSDIMDSLATFTTPNDEIQTNEDMEQLISKSESSNTRPSPTKRKRPPSIATPKGSTLPKKSKILVSSSKLEGKIELNTGFHVPLNDTAPDISPDEYKNLDALMTQFCKVPLLAEFSRPVSLLHPELSSVYKKVIHNPIDLGKVSRAIRKREYQNTRQICVDVWRIFTNCVKYHTHPITREGAIPSFVSIANHLREYFNALWLEYMIPSEIAVGNSKKAVEHALKNAEDKRTQFRRERIETISTTVLSDRLLLKIADEIDAFVKSNGKVDALDMLPISSLSDDDASAEAIRACDNALTSLSRKLRELVGTDVDYTVLTLHHDISCCYGDDVFEGLPWLKIKFEKRLTRLLGKLLAPLNEISCRGVNQSSVWGCMAAVIWARENMKKPFWPALVLGILAPDDQSEDWHTYLTERNESRLPEKLHAGLQAGKKKAIQAIERQSAGSSERMSYFLVEFLGTHEFIWVREADIVENFDPSININDDLANSVSAKKKSFLRGVISQNAKMLAKATDEGRWALDEFDMLMNDPCGDQMELMVDEDEEENYSYCVLCESDEEADQVDRSRDAEHISKGDNVFETPTGDIYDLEEINELLATDGVLDITTEGKKMSKKRALVLKKLQQSDSKKTTVKSEKKEKKLSGKDVKPIKPHLSEIFSQKDFKDIEKRRKQRQRDREKFLKDEDKRSKKSKIDGGSIIRKGRKIGIADKRRRAAIIVRGYLNRIAARDGLKGLSLGGLATLPAANVEGSGILGIALAFRAAAGELDMPDVKDNPTCIKPWEHVPLDRLSSEERCNALTHKIELLKKAMDRLTKDTELRLKLIEDAKKAKEDYDTALHLAESEARHSDIPKRKPQTKQKESTVEQKLIVPVLSDVNSDNEDISSLKMDLEMTSENGAEVSSGQNMMIETVDERIIHVTGDHLTVTSHNQQRF